MWCFLSYHQYDPFPSLLCPVRSSPLVQSLACNNVQYIPYNVLDPSPLCSVTNGLKSHFLWCSWTWVLILSLDKLLSTVPVSSFSFINLWSVARCLAGLNVLSGDSVDISHITWHCSTTFCMLGGYGNLGGWDGVSHQISKGLIPVDLHAHALSWGRAKGSAVTKSMRVETAIVCQFWFQHSIYTLSTVSALCGWMVLLQFFTQCFDNLVLKACSNVWGRFSRHSPSGHHIFH